MSSGRPVMIIDESGSTPLHYAAFGGQVKVLEYLLRPAWVHPERSQPGESNAAALGGDGRGSANAVDFLVTHGATIDARTAWATRPCRGGRVRSGPGGRLSHPERCESQRCGATKD